MSKISINFRDIDQIEHLPNKMSNGLEWPKISIVTPSYNQGQFIEETIRSIVFQGYPNLEYIIIDGHSTDDTVEIIKKYEEYITYWVSEPDNGQTHAINKGLSRATGDIIAYINSDDYYLPHTFEKVAQHFQEFPDTDLLHGICRYVNQKGEKIGEQFGNIHKPEEILDLWGVWWRKRQFVQPEVFWSKRITEKIGLFQEELYFVMDYDYWCRIILNGGIVRSIKSELSCFRFTDHQKSNHSEKVAQELLNVVYPMLWDKKLSLPLKKRLMLQGQWIYGGKILPEIHKSLVHKDSTIKRWLKILNIILKNPQILLSSCFQKKFSLWLKNLSILNQII